MTIITVSAPGIDDLVLAKGDGWNVRPFDWRTGSPRVVESDAPDAHGSIDTTSLTSSGMLTLGLRMVPTVSPLWTMHDALTRFTHPVLRPVVTVDREDGSPVRQVVTSRMSVSSPVERPSHRDAVVQWVVPFGIWESAVEHTTVIRPGAPIVDGIEFDGIEFDGIEFPLVEPLGVGTVTNDGDRDVYPIIRAFGPFGDEGVGADETVIENESTGRALVFAGMGIVTGDYLEIDFRTHTIRVNGLTSQSRYQYLSFPDSAWWTLAPGPNEIAFRPDTFSGNAQMHVIHRSAWA